MLQSLRLAISGQGPKQALDHGPDGPRTPLSDTPDVECPSSNGLVNRTSSRSSSPVNSKSTDVYRTPMSPRTSEKLLAHGSSRSTLSTFGSYPSGKAAAQRGRQRHLLLLLVLLLPAVTGLAVMGIRLRSSETEHALIRPPSATAYAWRGADDERRTISNVQYSKDDEDDITAMRPQSYAQMRYRNRDRLPKWAKRILKAVKTFFAKDPVATYLLHDGPMTWYWNWLTKKKWWPTPLWDKYALVRGAPFLWGSPDQLCSIVNATDDVALVGNGPLTSEQRQAINQAGTVVRINALNNRLPGDKIDVWLCRYNGLGPANFWGFKQLSYREAEEVVGASQAVVFLGGHPTKLMAYAVEELLTWYPFVPVEKSMQINITGYWDLYNRILSDRTTLLKAGAMPSSGLLGALATVPCMRPGQKLHVYGFNWNPQAWFMHKMDSEQKIIKRLFRGMDVSIHPTACDGMYTCDKLCDGLFYRIAKDGDKTVCEAKAIEEERKKRQEASARKQKRSAAMQAMLAKPGYQGGMLESAIEVAQDDPSWVLDGSIRPVKEKVEIGSWNTIGGQVDPKVEALVEAHESFKYSKADKVPGVFSKSDGYLYNEQGIKLGKADDIGTGADDLLRAGALEEFAEVAEANAAGEVKEWTGKSAGAAEGAYTKGFFSGEDSGPLDLEEAAAEAGELVEVEGEAQEEQDQAAEAEKDRQMDALLTEEAAYPTESQEAAKRSAADAAAQEGVDDMLAEQRGADDAEREPDETADDADEEEEDPDDTGAESS